MASLVAEGAEQLFKLFSRSGGKNVEIFAKSVDHARNLNFSKLMREARAAYKNNPADMVEIGGKIHYMKDGHLLKIDKSLLEGGFSARWKSFHEWAWVNWQKLATWISKNNILVGKDAAFHAKKEGFFRPILEMGEQAHISGSKVLSEEALARHNKVFDIFGNKTAAKDVVEAATKNNMAHAVQDIPTTINTASGELNVTTHNIGKAEDLVDTPLQGKKVLTAQFENPKAALTLNDEADKLIADHLENGLVIKLGESGVVENLDDLLIKLADGLDPVKVKQANDLILQTVKNAGGVSHPISISAEGLQHLKPLVTNVKGEVIDTSLRGVVDKVVAQKTAGLTDVDGALNAAQIKLHTPLLSAFKRAFGGNAAALTEIETLLGSKTFNMPLG